MSKSTFGWRRAGISGMAAALVFGGTLAGAGAASAAADTSFAYSGFDAVLPDTEGKTLGTATITESGASASFSSAAPTTVVLTLDSALGASFTDGVTPTITTSAGHTSTSPPTDGSLGTYSFDVTTTAGASAATISVSGLKANVNGVEQISMESSEGTETPKMLNVVNYGNANRLGGATRYETAAALFNAGPGAEVYSSDPDDYGSGPHVAVLSGGELFPDALSANYLASAFDTGTLLTTANTLSQAARNAIIDNNIRRVYITGETGAVSKAVEDQLESMRISNDPMEQLITTVRLGGNDRYDTNRIVNNFADSVNGNPTPTVLLSSGENFPDALAFGPIAYANQYPLVMTQGSLLSDQASSQLASFNPDDVVISGGTGAVSAGAASSVSATGADVSRLGGDDRSETATMIAEWATEGSLDAPAGSFLETGLDFTTATVSLTWTGTAQGFGDALAAGPLAGDERSVILLANSTTAPGEYIEDYLGLKFVDNSAGVANVGTLRALGETGVTSSALM